MLKAAKSLAHLHAAVVVEELYRCGVERFCLSPGARTIPLVLALQEHPAVTTKLFNDERSAAFWAQGAAKGGEFPCLVCTSGTAAANYLPAVVEASMAGTPLLVLTTDRPFELHYAKANQTLPQHDLFIPFVQEVFDLPAPEQQLFPHALLADLDQAVFEARRTARPVHINLAYRKPFVDTAFTMAALPPKEVRDLERWQASGRPYCEYLLPQPRLSAADSRRIMERIEAADDIVCVAGPLAPTRSSLAVRQLAAHLAAPLFADINSGLRFASPPAAVFSLYNLYLRRALSQLPPATLVLYFGDRIVSEPLREYLAAQQGELILCSSYALRQDAIENEFIYPTMKLWGEPDTLAAELLALLPSRQPTALAQTLAAYEAKAQQQLTTLLAAPAGALTEGRVIYEIFQHIDDDAAIFLSASLIFREAEYFVPCGPKNLQVGANRGATGIDGVLSSGIGFGAGLHKPCTVLIGDQALLHDLNALALLAAADVPIYVMVINNHSGAIFHFFELGVAIGQQLRNPHPWHFRSVAENFHLAYVYPASLPDLISSYRAAQRQRRSTLFEIIVDGEASVRLFQAASMS